MRKSVLLAVSFAALLLVIGISLLAVSRNARSSGERIARLQDAHVSAGAALNAIRANVYLHGILIRDYLLDNDPSHAQQYGDQFRSIQARTAESFNKLRISGQEAAQEEALALLEGEVQAHWDPTQVTLDWTPAEKRAYGPAMLRQRVRRRQEIIELALRVQEMLQANFLSERERVWSAARDFQVSLAWTTSIALVMGFGIAVATIIQMMSLERQSQAAASELRRLTVQLRSTQEQERKFLSRELHDQVGQMLTGLRMELSNLARIDGDQNSDLSAKIADAKDSVEQTLRVIRNIAMLLRPSMLDDLGLTPALTWLTKEVLRPGGIEVHSEIESSVDSLPDAYRTCIYRVVQEALTNAVRHSGANRVDLALHLRDGWVIGGVSDNGRGFDPQAKRSGLGLLGMEERVRELGGSIRIFSAPGKGATVEFRMAQPAAPKEQDDTHPDSRRPRDRSDGIEASA